MPSDPFSIFYNMAEDMASNLIYERYSGCHYIITDFDIHIILDFRDFYSITNLINSGNSAGVNFQS